MPYADKEKKREYDRARYLAKKLGQREQKKQEKNAEKWVREHDTDIFDYYQQHSEDESSKPIYREHKDDRDDKPQPIGVNLWHSEFNEEPKPQETQIQKDFKKVMRDEGKYCD